MLATSPSSILSGLLVLVVEASDTAHISATLAAHGAQVIAVDSGDRAMKVLTIVIPDLLVSDLDLPGDHALALIQRVRGLARGGAIRAVAVTADEDAERDDSYQEHLNKPLDDECLLDAIERIIGRPRDDRQVVSLSNDDHDIAAILSGKR
jgi:CheY-like chemotaxis protein